MSHLLPTKRKKTKERKRKKEKHENKLKREMEKIKMSDRVEKCAINKIENALFFTPSLSLSATYTGKRKTFHCNIASVYKERHQIFLLTYFRYHDAIIIIAMRRQRQWERNHKSRRKIVFFHFGVLACLT